MILLVPPILARHIYSCVCQQSPKHFAFTSARVSNLQRLCCLTRAPYGGSLLQCCQRLTNPHGRADSPRRRCAHIASSMSVLAFSHQSKDLGWTCASASDTNASHMLSLNFSRFSAPVGRIHDSAIPRPSSLLPAQASDLRAAAKLRRRILPRIALLPVCASARVVRSASTRLPQPRAWASMALFSPMRTRGNGPRILHHHSSPPVGTSVSTGRHL